MKRRGEKSKGKDEGRREMRDKMEEYARKERK